MTGAMPAWAKPIVLHALLHCFSQFILTPKGGHEHEENLPKIKKRRDLKPSVIY